MVSCGKLVSTEMNEVFYGLEKANRQQQNHNYDSSRD